MIAKKMSLGFTLIELLIVVAIIAILAAIAVPNFLEAQTRAKVSRAKADMRTIVTALESYRVDNNNYPIDRFGVTLADPRFEWTYPRDADTALHALTTPISYITGIPTNIFPNETDNPPGDDFQPQYRYFAEHWKEGILAAQAGNPLYSAESAWEWTLSSSGPNGISNLGEYLVFGFETFDEKFPIFLPGFNAGPTAIYNPTNGTISDGDIVFVGPGGPVY